MANNKITEAIAINGQFFERAIDGTLLPLSGQTDWEELKSRSDAEIEIAASNDEDNPPVSEEQWQAALSGRRNRG